MKTPDEWSKEIISYVRMHPATTPEATRLLVRTIVEWVQKDALESTGDFRQRKA